MQSDDSCASSSDLVTVPGFNANGSYNDATGIGTVDLLRSFRRWPVRQLRK